MYQISSTMCTRYIKLYNRLKKDFSCIYFQYRTCIISHYVTLNMTYHKIEEAQIYMNFNKVTSSYAKFIRLGDFH